MPIIKSGGNRVVIDEEVTDDHTHVQVVWFGLSMDGRFRVPFHGPIEPVAEYEAAVAWAVEMATQMVFPLYVIPMTGAEVMRTPEAQQALDSLTAQQRGELRREVISMLARVMRDCDDPVVRADAHEVLVQMRVVTG
jgi:hypothetical protein